MISLIMILNVQRIGADWLSTDWIWLCVVKHVEEITWSVWGDLIRKDLRAVAAKDRAD